jgi:hypothetical protein
MRLTMFRFTNTARRAFDLRALAAALWSTNFGLFAQSGTRLVNTAKWDFGTCETTAS